MAITNESRKKAEALIYEVLDALDNTKTNSDHYKQVFSKMSNTQFENLFKKKFPLRFHTDVFNIVPKVEDMEKAADILGIPLLEKINMPYLYKNDKGEPVKSKECLVGYIHLRKVQQFLTKKNSMSTDINQRDMRTGLLVNYDKNGKTSDRETEALVTMGLSKTIDEFVGPRADSMNAKNSMYQAINVSGMVSLSDIPQEPEDSLSMNLFNVYMIGAHLNSNLLNIDYQLPYTQKKKEIKRN